MRGFVSLQHAENQTSLRECFLASSPQPGICQMVGVHQISHSHRKRKETDAFCTFPIKAAAADLSIMCATKRETLRTWTGFWPQVGLMSELALIIPDPTCGKEDKAAAHSMLCGLTILRHNAITPLRLKIDQEIQEAKRFPCLLASSTIHLKLTGSVSANKQRLFLSTYIWQQVIPSFPKLVS